eukprot:jgi/Psemu1/45470/gm1.45470_g
MLAVGHIHQPITQFLCYDMRSQQKWHQWIFMDHIPYVFRKIFVTDPEVLCNNLLDEWLPILIPYSYLPESRKIFTPLTEPLVEMLVDQSDELFTAKLEVVFLSRTGVQNINEHFGKEGNEMYLSGVFKPLEGSNFKYHTFLDFETWECFKDSKADLQNFKKSQTGPYVAGWVMFTSKRKDMVPTIHDDGSDKVEDNVNKSDQGNDEDGEGNKSDQGNDKDGTLDNCDDVSDPRQEKGSKSDQGNGKDGNLDNDGDNVSDSRQDKGNKSDEGNNKDGTWDKDCNLKPKAKPTTSKGTKSSLVRDLEFAPKDWSHIGRDFAFLEIKVMLKDPDLEILYPIYRIGQKVVYIGDINRIGLVDRYVSERHKDYDAYPGYKLFFQLDDGMDEYEWFPFFEVSHVSEQDCPINRISDLVQCYSEKHGRNSGKTQRNNAEGNLVGDKNFNSSSDLNNMPDNNKGSVYDPVVDRDSESKEEDECQ